ncbi:hypothetical protein Dvina_01470 [Dactylosporangium vinaceum]|uniref:LamG domain-containing protein n=1 Tax=Dactylosporangium vinaceum TaxID=53362 RepID=A0ABV5MLL6_9ACTN|nr:LamG domain-containing protein [Dactylosporangium vinaceum]UAB96928.1 hypothetical protein Dvina_01470 [Dactylosporangium vinaceum]
MPDLHLPDVFVGVAWNAEPFDSAATPTWTDLAARAISIGSASRGRQYELDQNQTGAMSVDWLNIDEALNPGNGGSPYSPNVQPYRQIMPRVMWPNGGTGNLINAAYNIQNGVGTDPSFESYSAGAPPAWVLYSGTGVQASAAITTTNPQQGTKSLTYNVVNGGGISGVGVTVPCIPGRQYTSTLYVRQTGANTTQIFINGGAGGTSTTTTGAYVRLTVTWTATQPTHQLWVASFTTSINSTVNVDALQHEPGGSASAFTTTGPLIRNVWTRGYVERWPTAWEDNGFRGVSSTPAVGPFFILSNADLWTEARNAILVKAPTYYWPLQEPKGATRYAEASGNNGPALLPYAPKTGAGAGITAGVNSAILGDSGGTGVQFTADGAHGAFSALQTSTVLAIGQTGALSLSPLPPSPPAAWAATWACWAYWPATPSDYMIIMWSNAKYNLWNPMVLTQLAGTGRLELKLQGSTGSAAFATSASAPAAGVWHHLACVASQDATNTNLALYIDGVLAQATTTATSTVGLASGLPADQFFIGGAIAYMGHYLTEAWTGVVAHAAIWYRALSAGEVADLATAGLTAYANELSGARITRYLSYAGYTGPTSIQPGASAMAASTLTKGTAALTACQSVADSEFGNLFESADGIAFASRFDRSLKTTAVYTFGENTAAGEYPYQGDVAYDFDPSRVFNMADITRSGGIIAHAEPADGGLSRKRFGPKPFTRTINIASDNETVDAATWVVLNGATARQRLASITFDAAATRVPFGDGTLWPMVLTIEIGTRVTVKRRPKAANGGAGITMSGDFFVEQVTHHDINFERGTWLVTLLLSPASGAQPWILQDATYGALGTTSVLGF